MKRFAWRVAKFVFKAVLFVLLVTVGWVFLYKYVNPPVTPLMVMKYFREGQPIKKEWKGYGEISGNMKLAVIAAEDQIYPEHSGFDVDSIIDAIEDKQSGKRLRGASTISQQTAKNVFLWPSRTWTRKGAETYFTFLIETLWGKKRILEMYLNVMETGPGIYGAEKAAEIYFGKPAKSLTKAEAALIAAVLPNPERMSPGRPSEYVRERQAWIMGQMSNLGGTAYLKKLE